jgi:hypothetical protein
VLIQLKRLRAVSAVLLGALLLRVLTGVGFANYDTLYALVWGQQLSRGQSPRYDIPLAPTPHPLVETLGFVLSPLGPRAVEDVAVALGFVALAGCGWLIYQLGSLWFGRAAGALAALILLTRVPVLSDGVRAYVDIPYLLLVLAALLIEARRHSAEVEGNRRRGSPAGVLVLLALAGLLRPEAWVFSGLYWLYVAFGDRIARRQTAGARSDGRAGGQAAIGQEVDARADGGRPAELAWLALLAISAPLLWMLSDLLVTGDALWSLTNTRHTAQVLDRVTGLGNVPEYIPRRIGEILRPPVLAAAALGGVLSLLWLRRRARAAAILGVLAVLVFAAFATVGLPINTRYAFLAAAILCLFAGAGVLGWTQLPRGDRRRGPWMWTGLALGLALLAYAPSQYRSAHHELTELSRQQTIQADLVALVEDHSISLRCGLVGVPNHRPIPLLALHLRTSPANILSAQIRRISHGVYVGPATPGVEKNYILDLHETRLLKAAVPPGFLATGANDSWRVFERCVGARRP